MTNRKEVAEKLREAGEAAEEVGTYPASALNDITNIIGTNEITSYQTFFNSLADLIDPTCHMSCECGSGDEVIEEYMDNIVFTPEDTVACHCHTCDMVFRYDRGIIPNYCPNCGARVVRDDDMKEPKTVEEQTVLPSNDYADNQTLALAT